MSYNQISHINLFSKENRKLIEFYKSLGMTSLGDDQPDSWHGFDTEGTTFAIEPESNKLKVANELGIAREDALLIQFKASNIEELKKMTEAAEKAGAKVMWRRKKVSYGIVTNFLDPDNNLIEILLEK